MKKNTNVLGKGLGALLGEVGNVDELRKPIGYVNKEVAGTKPVQKSSDVLMVPVERIEVNPYQPRLQFDENKIDELAVSISNLGLIQPITVRSTASGKFQIISGERRFRACIKAGMDMIPAYVRDATDLNMLEMSIIENVQREDLDPIEIALGYRALMEECNLTQEEMAKRIGKKRASIANYIRLLRLPDKVQHDLRDGLISVGHAKVLLSVGDYEVQQKLCDLVIAKGLTVLELEQKVARDIPRNYADLASRVQQFFSGNVSFRRSPTGKGSITIRFNSDEEVDKFLNSIKR